MKFITSIFFLLLISVNNLWSQSNLPSNELPIDKEATKKTIRLYKNLKTISKKGTMFGHEDASAYGIGWWAEKDQSDAKKLTGSYPAVHGWDLGDIGLSSSNLDTVNFKKMRSWIKDTYNRGGINTISWHLDNPKTGGSSWDKTPTVADILPGGSSHEAYLIQLDALAEFLKSCKVLFTKTPIIFRPFHEHNGNWFWWGKDHCSEEDYIALWRFTVSYLKEEKNIHHLLYAFSPDRSRMDLSEGEKAYFYGYPGDEYVDIIGLDNYWDVGHPANKVSVEQQEKDFLQSLQLIHIIAENKNKIAALTETGNGGLNEDDWFTNRILSVLENNPSLEIAWLLVWRNRFAEGAYVPYEGHNAAPDFKKFHDSPLIIFENNIKSIYSKNMQLE